ncbi:MAG: cytochrome c oxidase subunit 3 [Candidatus Binataceae bacterium]
MSEAVAATGADFVRQDVPPDSARIGRWMFIAGDAMVFGAALAAYGALRFRNVNWPNPAATLGIGLAAIMTFVLLGSSFTMAVAIAGIRRGDRGKFRIGLALTIIGGVVFLSMQAFEWHRLIWDERLSIQTSLFAAAFFLLTGFQGMHVAGGIIYNAVLYVRGRSGKLPVETTESVEIAGLHWHFVNIVWILIFTFVYLM